MFANRFSNSASRFKKSEDSQKHYLTSMEMLGGLFDPSKTRTSLPENASLTRKSKFKWVNKNSKLKKITAMPVDLSHFKEVSIAETTMTLNHIEDHYKMLMPFRNIISKGWFSQTICDTNCINSTLFDLKSCCFISNKYLPSNTINLDNFLITFSSGRQRHKNFTESLKPSPLITLSRHKLVRNKKSQCESSDSSVVYRTRRKLIRKPELVAQNGYIKNSESILKKMNVDSAKERDTRAESVCAKARDATVLRGTSTVSRRLREKSSGKLVIVNRNKLIRSSLLKGKVKSSPKSVLRHVIQRRGCLYSGSSYALLARNKLISQKLKLKWRSIDSPKSNVRKSSRIARTFVSVGDNKLIRKSLFRKNNKPASKSIDQSAPFRKFILTRVLTSPSKRIQRFTNHLSRINMKYVREGKIRYLNKCKNNKLRRKKSTKICPVYQTKGSCIRQTKKICCMVHDPKYIALCPKFLKGNCEDDECRLSHDMIPQKVPNCLYYLQDNCKADKCIYLHTKPDLKADICREFLKGYCELADKCSSWHIRACPSFKSASNCEKGDRCRLPHRGESYFESKPVKEEETSANWRYFDSNYLNDDGAIMEESITIEDNPMESLPDFIPL